MTKIYRRVLATNHRLFKNPKQSEENKNKGITAGDVIAFFAFLVSGFSVWFSIFQYQQQKVDSAIQDSLNTVRFEKQLNQIRFNDSTQRAIAIENLASSKKNFERQIKEVMLSNAAKRLTDSIQNQVSIQNSKNSVRPLLYVEKVAAPVEAEAFGILLKNEGIGPAILDDVKIKFDGIDESLDHIETFGRSINLNCFSGKWMWFSAQRNTIIRNGNSLWLFRIPNHSVSNLDLLDSLINRHIIINISYHSLTNDSFVLNH